MPTPAEMYELYKLMGRPNNQQMQHLLDNSDLLATLGEAAQAEVLSYVDRVAFADALAPPKLEIPWNPPDTYVGRIMERSKERGWGFTYVHAESLEAQLHDHKGPLLPTGVRIRLGRGVHFAWSEAMCWIKSELNRLGHILEQAVAGRVSHHPSSQYRSGGLSLDAVDLDLDTFWIRSDNQAVQHVVDDLRPTRKTWPGMEVPWLLALNPEAYISTNGRTIPFMLAPGLSIGSRSLPLFRRTNSKTVGVYARWLNTNTALEGASVVAFRE